MRKNNIIKRMTALFLMLIMAVTMLPQPVQAAGVSVTPGGTQMVVGASVQLKVKGSYRKVTWKSANTGIATVTSRGKVTAKKSGRTRINATITLKNGRKTTDYCKVVVLSSGKLVTLKTADDATAATVHKYLTSNTPFSIVYYGSSSQAASNLNKLKEKVGKVNEYGVLFQNNRAEQVCDAQKTGYVYRVTKDNCRLYNYSLKYFKRLVAKALGGSFNDDLDNNLNYIFYPDGRLAFARKFSTWQEYQAAVIANDKEDDDGYIVNNLRPNGCDDDNNLRKYWLVANTKFCDLSQAMKVYVIDDAQFFCGTSTAEEKEKYNMFEMTYAQTTDGGESRYQSDLERMKIMSENKADGVCEDYARYEVTVFTQLGIKSKYDHDGGHAWSVVYPTNADGKKLKLILDYRLYCGSESIYDRNLSPESDIY